MGKVDRACESLGSQQGGASFSHCEEDVSCVQDKVSRTQEEPSAIRSALCVGESRYVSAGGKAERVLHDNGISVPFFSKIPFKREVRGKKGCSRGGVAHYFSLQFVKFVPVDHVAMIIRYLSAIP